MNSALFINALSAIGGSSITILLAYPFARRADRRESDLRETVDYYQTKQPELLDRIKKLTKEHDRLAKHNTELSDTAGRAVHARNDALKEVASLKADLATSYFRNAKGQMQKRGA